MDVFFWWVFDALLVITAVWVIFLSAKKGLTKAWIFCIGYIIATVAASVLSAVSAPTMYEVFVRESNITAITEVNREVDIAKCLYEAIDDADYGAEISLSKVQSYLAAPNTDAFDRNLYEYVKRENGYAIGSLMDFKKMLTNAFSDTYGEALSEHLPYYAQVNFREQMTNDPAAIHSMFSAFYDVYADDEERAIYVEDAFVKDTTVHLFQMFIYVVIFSVVMTFAALFDKLLQYKMIFNLRKLSDHTLGAVIGLVEAVVMVLLLTLVVRLLVVLGGGELFCFNEKTIQAGKLFKHVYNHIDMLL